jgi:DNA-binding Xre family transcriptional regulator
METQSIVNMLKRALKFHRVTYADIAYELDLSEASVKRMFAKQHFTLERLESICSMVNLDFTDLLRLVDEDQHRISNLSHKQEEELVSDLKFLLIAICVQSNWTYEEIIGYYKISEPECIKYLAKLDKIKFGIWLQKISDGCRVDQLKNFLKRLLRVSFWIHISLVQVK